MLAYIIIKIQYTVYEDTMLRKDCTKQNGHGQDRLHLQSPVKGAPCCHWINKPPLPLVSPHPTITHILRTPQRRATG